MIRFIIYSLPNLNLSKRGIGVVVSILKLLILGLRFGFHGGTEKKKNQSMIFISVGTGL